MTDSISDFIIRLKNGSLANNQTVVSPHSKLRENLAQLLVKQNYLAGYKVDTTGKFKQLVINLKSTGVKVNRLNIKLISKPGRRVYAQANQLNRFSLGVGSVIISTPSGLMTTKQAYKAKLGGELLCRITIR